MILASAGLTGGNEGVAGVTTGAGTTAAGGGALSPGGSAPAGAGEARVSPAVVVPVTGAGSFERPIECKRKTISTPRRPSGLGSLAAAC